MTKPTKLSEIDTAKLTFTELKAGGKGGKAGGAKKDGEGQRQRQKKPEGARPPDARAGGTGNKRAPGGGPKSGAGGKEGP